MKFAGKNSLFLKFLLILMACGVLILLYQIFISSIWAGIHGAYTPMKRNYVEIRPPDDIPEIQPPRPSDEPGTWFWKKGHWRYYDNKGKNWTWIRGAWAKRVFSHDEYIALGETEEWQPEHWEKSGPGWVLKGGHEGNVLDEYTEPIYADSPPPPEKIENLPPVPTTYSAYPPDKWFWKKGSWIWSNNKYEWVAGQWNVKPEDFYRWVPARWEPHAGNGWRKWLYVRGYIEYEHSNGRITTNCCSK